MTDGSSGSLDAPRLVEVPLGQPVSLGHTQQPRRFDHPGDTLSAVGVEAAGASIGPLHLDVPHRMPEPVDRVNRRAADNALESSRAPFDNEPVVEFQVGERGWGVGVDANGFGCPELGFGLAPTSAVAVGRGELIEATERVVPAESGVPTRAFIVDVSTGLGSTLRTECHQPLPATTAKVCVGATGSVCQSVTAGPSSGGGRSDRL